MAILQSTKFWEKTSTRTFLASGLTPYLSMLGLVRLKYIRECTSYLQGVVVDTEAHSINVENLGSR